MFKIKLLLAFNCLWFFSCKNETTKQLSINFSADSTAIVIKNIEPSNLYQIKSNIKTDTAYQSLVSVLQTPGGDEPTGMEINWPGKIDVIGDSLLFTPKQPFVKGKIYLVETIINAQFGGTKDVIRSKVGRRIKAKQQILEL